MASSHSAALAQWRRIEALVQAWLDERQQLIVLLCTLQGLKGLSDHRQPLQKQVQQFCQLLMDYISAVEHALGVSAEKQLLPMQPGDVPATAADTSALEAWVQFKPSTPVKEGVARFVAWYRQFYGV